MEEINALLEKFNNFKDAQIRSIQVAADSAITVALVVQDDDGEDIHSVKIEFKNINDARLLENSVLPYLDMMSGVSIIKEHNLYGFAIGNCNAMLNIKNTPLYIVSSDINVEDKPI